MTIQQHISLKPYNTFGLGVQARYFAPFKDGGELAALLAQTRSNTKMVLGGGSNILFTGDFDGLVLKNEVMGIETVAEDEDYVYVSA